MRTGKVRVVDPDGNSLAEAVVSPSGFRTVIGRASHYGWPRAIGEMPKVKTDKNGIADVQFPKHIREKDEIGTVTWMVQHPDFVMFREDFSVDEETADIKMKRGYRVAVTAVDAVTGETIKENIFAVMSGFNVKPWKLKKGTLVSPIYPMQNRGGIRVVRFAEGQPTLFSPFVKIEPDGKGRIFIKDVKLAKGIRIEGKLDDKVPRPVKNGIVVAAACRRPAPRAYDSQWQWAEEITIAEDGSFVFESFPPEEVIQLLPYCDGWMPAKPTKAIVEKHFPDDGPRLREVPMVIPQIFETAEEVVSVTTPMTESASIKLTLLDPDGTPVPDVKVYMSPNHVWFQGSGGIMGMHNTTPKALLASLKEPDGTKRRPSRLPASADTNKDGVAMIPNLAGATHSISVSHKDFELPISNRRRTLRIRLKEGEMTEETVTLERKGTSVLGENLP